MHHCNSAARRAVNLVVLLAVAFAALAASAAQAHDPSLELRAHGTAVVDGVQSPGEWDRAAKWDFTANIPGGSTPATLYSMNDGINLYLAVKRGRPDLFGALNFAFDNNHNGDLYEEGDDVLILSSFGFSDMFVSRLPPCQPPYTCIGINDTDVGGTSDGSGVVRTTGTEAFFELSHPLNTADDGHDFSLRYGKTAGIRLSVTTCGTVCAYTNSPSGDVVAVSTSTIAPETQIVRGPADRSFSRRQILEFTFSGSDDVVAAEDLGFECSENGGPFELCENPYEYQPERQGSQSLRVRAVDDVRNVDPTPAVRQWTFDTTPPAKPSIRGPRRFKGARVVYRLRATDNVDRPKQLHFRCSLDLVRFKPCSARLALRVQRGRHVLRVTAVDRTGNVSKRTQAKFVRLNAD